MLTYGDRGLTLSFADVKQMSFHELDELAKLVDLQRKNESAAVEEIKRKNSANTTMPKGMNTSLKRR